MSSKIIWQTEEWGVLEEQINQAPKNFKPEFKEWLFKRPLLWKKLVSYGRRGVEKKDPYGFSALAVVQIIEMDSIVEDGPGHLESVDDRFVPDLGRLLIAVHPETLDLLWRGERYTHPMVKYAPDLAQLFESEHSEYNDFFSPEKDAIFNDPEYMVFPELSGLPPAGPDEISESRQ